MRLCRHPVRRCTTTASQQSSDIAWPSCPVSSSLELLLLLRCCFPVWLPLLCGQLCLCLAPCVLCQCLLWRAMLSVFSGSDSVWIWLHGH